MKTDNGKHCLRFEYDHQGDLVAQYQDEVKLTFVYGSHHQQVGLPDGRTLKFDYTNTHKLGRIALDVHELTEFDYNDKGFESRQRVGALSILKQYDPYGRLSTQEQQHGVHGQSELMAHYHYDTAGNMLDSSVGLIGFSEQGFSERVTAFGHGLVMARCRWFGYKTGSH